jgi:hypothetical protein
MGSYRWTEPSSLDDAKRRGGGREEEEEEEEEKVTSMLSIHSTAQHSRAQQQHSLINLLTHLDDARRFLLCGEKLSERTAAGRVP